MFRWAIIFAVIALLASLLGFGGVAGLSANLAYIFLAVAVILFIVGYFILKGIGVLLKPFWKKIVSLLKMTKLLDHLLGLILSIIEGIIIVYFVLSMIFIPFINQFI